MAKLTGISDKLEKIAEIAAILEEQLNYDRQYQFHCEFIRKNWSILPEKVDDGVYFYSIPGVLPLFRSVFQVCGCQPLNVVNLKDLEDYVDEVKKLIGEMESESDKVLFDRPIQED